MSRLALNDPLPSADPDHSVLAALEDFLSSSCSQQPVEATTSAPRPTPPPLPIPPGAPIASSSSTVTSAAFRDRMGVDQQLRPHSPSIQVHQQQLCKRSAQDDEVGLDMELRAISLAGRQVNGPVPLMPPPVKNGRLFEERAEEEYCG